MAAVAAACPTSPRTDEDEEEMKDLGGEVDSARLELAAEPLRTSDSGAGMTRGVDVVFFVLRWIDFGGGGGGVGGRLGIFGGRCVLPTR